jgi:hypothetical protein
MFNPTILEATRREIKAAGLPSPAEGLETPFL